MSDEHFYDLVIIGGGPGGYVCAIRAAQLGGRVALIEKADLGGVCANAGCIPTKALHASADKGLSFEEAKKRMKNAVARSNKGVEFLLKSNNVDVVKGEAKLVSVNQVEVGEKLINGTNIVIATGSCDAELPHIRFGGHVLSGPGLLNLETMPETLAVIGGGYIGCEFASIFNSFGSKVSIIEADGRLLPRIGENEIAETLEKCMKRKGIDVFTNCKVDSVNGNQIIAGGRRIEAVKILLSVGRKPVFPAGLDKIGVNVGKQGILVDEKMKTNIGGVYAIGDAVGGGLAHVASAYGIVAAENILGYENKKGMDYSVIPSCVFTFPEIATVGDIKENEGVKIGKCPFIANGKANAMGETDGFVKVFVKDGNLIGAAIIGVHASDLIAEPALAIRTKLGVDKITGTIRAHPTLSEAFAEALLDSAGMGIHVKSKNNNK